jgi:hypothetical protein
MFATKYWGTWQSPGVLRKVVRSDGQVSTDKTAGFHSRPAKKQELRNANRALNKAARRSLARQLESMLHDNDPLE